MHTVQSTFVLDAFFPPNFGRAGLLESGKVGVDCNESGQWQCASLVLVYSCMARESNPAVNGETMG